MSQESIRRLVQLANARFLENKERTGMFEDNVRRAFDTVVDSGWEPKDVRAERLRREGLERRKKNVEVQVECGDNSDENDHVDLNIKDITNIFE